MGKERSKYLELFNRTIKENTVELPKEEGDYFEILNRTLEWFKEKNMNQEQKKV
jgi:hypothetical protein